MKRVHILVSGIVQGVSFRYFTKSVADEYELNGWVRNLIDGRVEIICEGENIEEFINTIEKGSVGSRVDNMQVEEKIVEDTKLDNFEIRPTSNY